MAYSIIFRIFLIAIALQSVVCDAFQNMHRHSLASDKSRTAKRKVSKESPISRAPSTHRMVMSDPVLVGNANKRAIVDSGSIPPYKFSKQQSLYVILNSIFITCLIVADVIGVKLFELKLPFSIFGVSSVEHTCGMLTFPITFLLGDIINEYYVRIHLQLLIYNRNFRLCKASSSPGCESNSAYSISWISDEHHCVCDHQLSASAAILRQAI
jgi:hypothetical protein